MSLKPRYVWRNAIFASTLSPSERLVALALEQYMNGSAANAWPSVPTLALSTALSVRTVQRALQNLVRDGWLEVAAPASQWRPTTYRAALRGDMVSGLNHDSGVTPCPPGVTTSAPSGDRVSPEPLRGTSKEPLIKRADARRKKKGARTVGAHHPHLKYLDEAGNG